MISDCIEFQVYDYCRMTPGFEDCQNSAHELNIRTTAHRLARKPTVQKMASSPILDLDDPKVWIEFCVTPNRFIGLLFADAVALKAYTPASFAIHGIKA